MISLSGWLPNGLRTATTLFSSRLPLNYLASSGPPPASSFVRHGRLASAWVFSEPASVPVLLFFTPAATLQTVVFVTLVALYQQRAVILEEPTGGENESSIDANAPRECFLTFDCNVKVRLLKIYH